MFSRDYFFSCFMAGLLAGSGFAAGLLGLTFAGLLAGSDFAAGLACSGFSADLVAGAGFAEACPLALLSQACRSLPSPTCLPVPLRGRLGVVGSCGGLARRFRLDGELGVLGLRSPLAMLGRQRAFRLRGSLGVFPMLD